MTQAINFESIDYEKHQVKKILVAIDKSGYKEKIVAYAITLAKSLGASVTAIHVLDKASIGAIGNMLGYYRGGKGEEYEKIIKKEAEDLLNEAKVILEKEGIRTNIEVVIKSSAAEGIIDYAEDNAVDLIVVAIKGATGVSRFLMGGVASSVLRHAHCPVLAVR